MWNSISGTLNLRGFDTICVETGGLEFLDDFGPPGARTKVYTWLHHYEDGMRLFGFPSSTERGVFQELMKVEGIGPKQALKILSGIHPERLARALDEGDLDALQRIQGVGPKLAQKMLLALKGKLVLTRDESSAPAPGSGAKSWADVVRALADMGFARPSVERAVQEIARDLPPQADEEREIFRRALLALSTGA